VVHNAIDNPGTTIHEYGHAMTYYERNWVRTRVIYRENANQVRSIQETRGHGKTPIARTQNSRLISKVGASCRVVFRHIHDFSNLCGCAEEVRI
jgi:hypothetical protein